MAAGSMSFGGLFCELWLPVLLCVKRKNTKWRIAKLACDCCNDVGHHRGARRNLKTLELEQQHGPTAVNLA